MIGGIIAVALTSILGVIGLAAFRGARSSGVGSMILHAAGVYGLVSDAIGDPPAD